MKHTHDLIKLVAKNMHHCGGNILEYVKARTNCSRAYCATKNMGDHHHLYDVYGKSVYYCECKKSMGERAYFPAYNMVGARIQCDSCLANCK